MKEFLKSASTSRKTEKSKISPPDKFQDVLKIMALLGIGGGFAFGILALLITLITTYSSDSECSPENYQAATGLFFMVIPLTIAGFYSLYELKENVYRN